MASFGTGVATGKLHEIIDGAMAADWENVSIHKYATHPGPEQEHGIMNDGTHQDGNDKNSPDDNNAETVLDKCDKDAIIGDTDEKNPKLNSPDSGLLEPTNVEDKTIEVVYGAEGVCNVHPPPKELSEQSLDSGLNKTESSAVDTENDHNGNAVTENEFKDDTVTDLKLSQDIVDEFDKHVQSKRTSKSERPTTDMEQSSETGTDNTNDAVVTNGYKNNRTVTMATYTCSKPAKQRQDSQATVAKPRVPSIPPSRQTTSSSAGGRGESQSECSLGKPDSGYSRRRDRRRREDTKSNYSRYREDSRDEALEGQMEEMDGEYEKKTDGYLNDRFQSPRQPYEDGATQKTLLELMTRGLGNFTEQMANVMIDKIRPEYETLSRQVAKEVQEATMFELKELREKIVNAQKALKDLEKEKDHMKKLLDNEKAKRIREAEEKDEQIKKLEKDLEQSKVSVKERDRVMKKAEHRAKAEEQKRMKLEQEYQGQIANLTRLLDRAKGDLLVYRSQKRIAQTLEKQETVTLRNRLDSKGLSHY